MNRRLSVFILVLLTAGISVCHAEQTDAEKRAYARQLVIALKTAQTAYGQGKLPEAKQAFKEVARLKPDYWQAQHILGIIAFQESDLISAKGYFEQALTLNPDNANIHYLYASTLTRMEKLEAADAQYKKTLQLDPEMVKVYNDYGTVLFRRGKFLDAIDNLEKARLLGKQTPTSLLILGMAYVRAKKPERAIEMVLALRDLKDEVKAESLEKFMRDSQPKPPPPPPKPAGMPQQGGAKKKPSKNPFQR